MLVTSHELIFEGVFAWDGVVCARARPVLGRESSLSGQDCPGHDLWVEWSLYSGDGCEVVVGNKE